jgi:hypothetical protein
MAQIDDPQSKHITHDSTKEVSCRQIRSVQERRADGREHLR